MKLRRRVMALSLCITVMMPKANAGLNEGFAALQKGDYATARHEWRPLAVRGNVDAQFCMGVMYNAGQGVTQNFKEAAKWYRLAAAQGHAEAQFNLDLMNAKKSTVR